MFAGESVKITVSVTDIRVCILQLTLDIKRISPAQVAFALSQYGGRVRLKHVETEDHRQVISPLYPPYSSKAFIPK